MDKRQVLTGNVTGVYDMSGCAWEYTAAYVSNDNEVITSYGSALADAKENFKDRYSATYHDIHDSNYAFSTPEKGHYGDAVWETSNGSEGSDSWYSDYSRFPYSKNPFFVRGGTYYQTAHAGVFDFDNGSGNGSSSYGFRVVVPVL